MDANSSFDALSAESIGQKLHRNPADSKPGSSAGSGISSSAGGGGDSIKDNNNLGKATPSYANQENCLRAAAAQAKKRQRFAVELDGIHCFENILPY